MMVLRDGAFLHVLQAESNRQTQRHTYMAKKTSLLFGQTLPADAEIPKPTAQKEGTFPYETFQKGSQNEVPDEPVRHQRPLTAIRVFKHVDRQDPGSSPPYQQAAIFGALQKSQEYQSVIVYDATKLGQIFQHMFMTDYILGLLK